MIGSRGWKLVVVAVAMAGMAASVGCKKSQVDPFPASGTVTGWQKTDATRVYAAKDLWQYIDGDAEQYIKAGVVSTATSEYKYDDKVEAVVDVHTMSAPEGAQKILETGLTSDAAKVPLGDECVQYSQSVAFRKGPYLVRIVAYELTPETPQALMTLARAVEAKL